jgi:hypothetical protein
MTSGRTAEARRAMLLSRRSVLHLVGPSLIGSNLLLTKITCSIAQEPSVVAENGVAEERAVEWLNDNHEGLIRPGTLIRDVTKEIEKAFEADKNLSITIGRGLTKRKQACQIWIFSGNFFVFPLTGEQETSIGIGEYAVTYWSGSRRDRTTFPLAAKLQALKIGDAKRLSGGAKLSGSVSCQKLEDVRADFSLRLTYRTKEYTRRTYTYLPETQAPPQDVIDFSLEQINTEGTKAHTGPLAMFVELCTEGKDQQQDILYSNTIAIMVNVVI